MEFVKDHLEPNEKSIQNLKNQAKIRAGMVLGVVGHKIGSRTLRPGKDRTFRYVFCGKVEIQGSICGPLEIRKTPQNHDFEHRSAFLAPKMLSGIGSGKTWKIYGIWIGKMRGFEMLNPSKPV